MRNEVENVENEVWFFFFSVLILQATKTLHQEPAQS